MKRELAWVAPDDISIPLLIIIIVLILVVIVIIIIIITVLILVIHRADCAGPTHQELQLQE